IRSAGTVLYAPGNNPSAAVATEISISNIGEPYEGVLVKIDSLIVVTAPDVNGEWKCINFIGDTLIVDNLASYTVPSVGDTLKSITGILDYSFGFYKIQPRNDNDIEYLLVYNWSGTVSLSDAPADSSGTIVTIREISVADTTDIHGAFSFTSVPEDTYTMVFEHIGYITDSLTYFLKGGAITNITLNKYPTYTLSGIVGLNDDPADSFGISISLTDSVLSQNIATDSSGYYEFTDLVAGDYTVVITKSYYTQDSVEISLSSDTTYNTSIDRLTGTVWGYAGLDDNPADSSGTIVALSGYSLYDTTGTNGMYEFTNLYQGYTYTMIFTHDTYQADTSDIFLDLSSKRVDVTLTKLAGISDDMPEKVIVESTDGAISFTYNKSVDAPTSMQLFDLTGRSILTEEILGSKGVYKLSVNKKLSKGVYFLQITGEDKPFIKKFVIVK
ncbi:MAG: carboxypeptidase regulatory-like domain-containing protein, partial [bacterium]